MPIHARRLDQAHGCSRPLATAQRPGKQPVRAAKHPTSQILSPQVEEGTKAISCTGSPIATCTSVQLIHQYSQTRKAQANGCLGGLEGMAQITYHGLEIAVVHRLLINLQDPVSSIVYTVDLRNEVESRQ